MFGPVNRPRSGNCISVNIRVYYNYLRVGEVPDTYYHVSDSRITSFYMHHLSDLSYSSWTSTLLTTISQQSNWLHRQKASCFVCLQRLRICCSHWTTPAFLLSRRTGGRYARPTLVVAGCTVTKADFSKLFSQAWRKSMTLSNIAASFRQTGIYPFNPYAIQIPGEKALTSKKKTLVEETGLPYIPLVSPVPKSQVPSEAVSPIMPLVQSPAARSSIILPPLLGSQQGARWAAAMHDPPTFSEAENRLFTTRYEEGYDINDDRHNISLRQNHPDVCITVKRPFHQALQSLRATCHSEMLSPI